MNVICLSRSFFIVGVISILLAFTTIVIFFDYFIDKYSVF